MYRDKATYVALMFAIFQKLMPIAVLSASFIQFLYVFMYKTGRLGEDMHR